MKKILFALTFLLNGLIIGIFGQNEKLDNLFSSFEKNPEVTSIDIKKPMFGLLKSFENNLNDDYLKNIGPLISQIDGIKMVIIPKSNNEGNDKTNKQKVDQVNNILNDLNFNELMTVNKNGAEMKFLAESNKGNILENLVFNVDSKDENFSIKLWKFIC